jgi:putative hemolysin
MMRLSVAVAGAMALTLAACAVPYQDQPYTAYPSAAPQYGYAAPPPAYVRPPPSGGSITLTLPPD